jgi:antirestriction protein ArdC
MTTTTKKPTPYEIITDRILDMLEQGTIPWQKGWRAAGAARNLASKKVYRGINQIILGCSGYSSPYWMTYKQAADKGGQVRKGEKSTPVVFWTWIDKRQPDQDDDTTAKSPGKIPLLRYYNVFNLEQIDGIEAPETDQPAADFTPIEHAEQIIAGMPGRPTLDHGGDRAYYRPSTDHVQMPIREAFNSPEEYYSTVFHELAHSTGHVSRLARPGITSQTAHFGNHEYSQEELVAEFTAAMLCGVAGIEQQTIENSAAYIQGWLKALQNDKKLAVIAAGQAQKAADLILGEIPAEIEA